MDWALGIVVENGRLAVQGINREGDLKTGRLTEVGVAGVPSCLKTTKRLGKLDFSSFAPVPAEDYLAAFDLKLPEGLENRHAVWESRLDGARIIVPSLVLMRAFFRPIKYLLPDMFRPHAMDKCCFVDFSQLPSKVIIESYWHSDGYMNGHGDINQPLSWMNFFPSAGKLAASVHQNAMLGNIGIEMPQGSARLTMHGVEVGDALFVTEVRIVSIHTDEQPIPEAVGHSKDIVFRGITDKGPSKGAVILTPKVLTGSDGRIEVTDPEWSAVEPLLLKGQMRRRESLNQRYLFDAILTKINSNVSWRKLVSKSGTGNNAQFAHRSWNSRGTFAPSLELLNKMRS